MTPSIDSKATEASPQIDAKSEAVQLFFSDMLSQVEEDFEKSGDSLMIRMKNMCSKMERRGWDTRLERLQGRPGLR